DPNWWKRDADLAVSLTVVAWLGGVIGIPTQTGGNRMLIWQFPSRLWLLCWFLTVFRRELAELGFETGAFPHGCGLGGWCDRYSDPNWWKRDADLAVSLTVVAKSLAECARPGCYRRGVSVGLQSGVKHEAGSASADSYEPGSSAGVRNRIPVRTGE
ncbi:hypothetical protein, partial [uncultured Actinomyces sp.]|uniref:hypothetical protein n=1 Tax=uncultured Actinomyces sp. TaxID=249061 RepID=UPI002609101A